MKKLILLLVTIISLTSFFPSASVKNSVNKILVIKHKRKLYLYHNDEVVKKYSISLGKQPKGHKEFEGDMKTPEGIYKIDSKSLTSSYHKNLGISYTNKKDKKLQIKNSTTNSKINNKTKRTKKKQNSSNKYDK